jgi:signal transduction histidine kinase/CheY-like chemotaxis protein
MTLSVLDSDEGALFFSAIRDVTDRKKAEQRSRQLEILAAEAEAANKAKSMFISTMSHEIRTPLNAIIGYSQLLLRDEGLTPEAKGNLKIINRSGEHLLHMVNESLDLAKIEAGREQLAPRSFDLPGLLRDLEAMFRLRAEAKKLELSVNLAGVPLQYVVADDGKIRQVLINLLANALKFTDRGRIALQVSLSPAPDGGLRLIAQVADTGCGMTAEEQAALFQPFVQGRAGRRARDGGSGLGLAISQKVAQLLGGAIAVTSTLGQGSTFVLDIPVERSKARDFHKHSGPGKRVVGLKPGQERPRILIVDDRPDNRDWLSQLLNALGFSARSAEDGEGAIQLSRQWSPHLILMDMHMPGMNGLEATRQIKAHPSGAHTVVIALTADAMDGYRRFVVKTEVSDFIIKPCAENELLEKIGKHLGLEYLYQDGTLDETKEWEEPAGLTALNRAMVRELPGQLVEQLRLATLVGDKTQLDELIREAGETGNPQTARALQALADEYQYDNLIRLLEGTWPK